MFDNEFHIPHDSQASLVSIVSSKMSEHSTEKETNASLNELKELLKTLKINHGETYTQKRAHLESGTILGTGKLKEIAEHAKLEGSNFLVFDFELTASQVRNIKRITGMSVIDRVHVILEIFARHARTREAKIQIEISRLKYLLPRLSGFWSHLGRQRGAKGAIGGEGEQQIELDRRIIRDRIEFYKKELKDIEKSRFQQRKRRSKKAITAALVGYTNAGKSSLMNRLCKVDVLEENKLFATLDSTYRMLNPDTKPPMILIDTVGFISNLPNTLIDGFKTTLESALEADLLIIVVDISDQNYKKHIEVTTKVLEDLSLSNKDKIIVFNKTDLLENQFTGKIVKRNYPDSFLISSFSDHDVSNLRSHIINYFLEKQSSFDLFIPYQLGEHHSKIKANTNIVKEVAHEKGIYYKVRVPEFIFNSLNLKNYILGPDEIDWDSI